MIEDGLLGNGGDLYPEAVHGTSVMFMRHAASRFAQTWAVQKRDSILKRVSSHSGSWFGSS
jgi:hypothetical protein